MSVSLEFPRFGSSDEAFAWFGTARVKCARELSALLGSNAAPDRVQECLGHIDLINAAVIEIARSAAGCDEPLM